MNDERVIRCMAWDLCGEYNQMIDDTHAVRLVGGRTLYYLAANTRNDEVRLERLADDGTLRIIRRYIKYDAPVELVPIEKGGKK